MTTKEASLSSIEVWQRLGDGGRKLAWRLADQMRIQMARKEIPAASQIELNHWAADPDLSFDADMGIHELRCYGVVEEITRIEFLRNRLCETDDMRLRSVLSDQIRQYEASPEAFSALEKPLLKLNETFYVFMLRHMDE
jgi:hypothetical protein